ncbi:surface protein PspC [Streptococcus pneumoniae]|nr:surface protein PspC [Streptococcus pneumoniae]
MFASKSERKVHYSIRKFSIGVASVVVASLFLGGVVHAEEGITSRLHLVGMKSSRIIKVYWRRSEKVWKKIDIPKMST